MTVVLDCRSMKSPVAILIVLAVLIGGVFYLEAQSATGQLWGVGRYSLTKGNIDLTGGRSQEVTFRLDTMTGEVHFVQTLDLGNGKSFPALMGIASPEQATALVKQIGK